MSVPSPYPNPTQLALLEQALIRRELAAREEAGRKAQELADESYAELSGAAGDQGDASGGDLLVDLDHAAVGLQLEVLRDVAAARARIAAGTYGQCVNCGDDIEYARLLAYPTAKRCLSCQEVHERRAGLVHSTL
ncbi:hypothetical protein GCM10023144_42390 [Pigmentiphaga soli]|uniref:Zinc finger DksA/TraR C4-type domain-containing protein n=1 Tax=Pigmentiphaga soli TaxID=1007095 RepID=A0ABP8HMZ2_9BURK